MAAYKAMTWLRLFLAASWLLTTVRVTIPDYGYDYSLFVNLAYDPMGWLHECYYIAAFYICLITLTYFWEYIDTARKTQILMRAMLRRIEKDL